MRILKFISFAILLASLVTPAVAQQRFALVIGNDRYENLPTLQKAVNDARTVGEHFERLGYEVILLENASRRQMNEKITELAGRISRGDTAAFFFAGHGVALRDVNYLLPTDIPAVREGQDDLIAREAVSATSIIDTLRERGARVVVMVLDACRDNPFKAAGSRGIGGARGLTLTTVEEGVFVLYSAGIGQTALDRLGDNDPDPNSVFTRTFARLMEQPGVSIQELAKTTQSEVRQLAATVNHVQMPAYYDQIDGAFMLAATAAAAATRPVVRQGPGSGRPFTATVKAKHSGKCLTVLGAVMQAGAGIIQWSCVGGPNQKWIFTPDGAGFYTMKAQHSGKCLQMVDGNKQRGAISWVEECIGNDAQKFKLVSDKAGSYSIATKDSGLCLGVYYATKDDNAPVLQWDCADVDQLKWQLVM